jgi:hypothetical protein
MKTDREKEKTVRDKLATVMCTMKLSRSQPGMNKRFSVKKPIKSHILFYGRKRKIGRSANSKVAPYTVF